MVRSNSIEGNAEKTTCFHPEEEALPLSAAAPIFLKRLYHLFYSWLVLAKQLSLLAMALCEGIGAMALPSELIVHIFSFLSDRDKLRASSVCSRWRECLFYPALWTELKLRVGGGCNGGGSTSEETSKLEFLMRKFGSFVRELQLELAPVEGYLSPLSNDPSPPRMDQPDSDPQLSERWRDAMATYLDQVLCVFSSTRNNR